MKTKLEMAHDYLIKLIEVAPEGSHKSELVIVAWQYVDLMQAEADKRKVIGVPEAILNIDDTCYLTGGNHQWDHISKYGSDRDYYVCPCGSEKHP